MSIVINTTILSNCCDELINHAKYYANKKDTFYNNSFGNCLTLNKYLSKIQNIYNDISRNIQNINEHLKDYYEDVEAFERQMSNGYGYIKAENINSLVNRYKGSINVFEIDSNIMFQIDTVSFLSNNVSAEIDDINIEKGMSLADLAVCALSFTEGIINVGEMIGDGVMLAGSGICSLLGFDDTATKIGDVIEKDWSKDLYYWTVDATGLNELADPNSTAANISSIAGNITGMVALSVLTGGAAASAFGTGTTTATTVTTLTSGAIGAATSAGSEAELALQQGASIEQAEVTGGIAAGIGALTSGISGRMDALSRGVGSNSGSLGIGNIAKYALASFGIGASEPLLNEMVHTSIYKNDGESGLVNNFINNISNDGILLQMFLTGVTNSLGTVGNAIGGIKNYDYYKQEIGDALKRTEIGVGSIIKTDNINDISYQLLNFYDTGLIKFEVNDQIYSLYEFIDLKNLSKLNNIKIGDSLKNIIFDGAARISKIFQNPINLSYAGDIAFEDINNHIDDILKAQTISSTLKILNIPQIVNILLGRLRYVDITNNKDFSNKILNEGLYHITSLESAQKIMDSSYVKASGNIASYGYKKSFFFAGTPEFGDVAINLPDFETKRVAIKFDIDESELADFKYRDWDDKAVTYRGDYNFDPKKAKIVYLGLTEENGKLVYKEISEQQYNNYETNLSSNKLSNTIRNLQQMAIGYAKGHEYAIKRLNTLKNNIMSGNNKEISNVDINLKSSELKYDIESLVKCYSEIVNRVSPELVFSDEFNYMLSDEFKNFIQKTKNVSLEFGMGYLNKRDINAAVEQIIINNKDIDQLTFTRMVDYVSSDEYLQKISASYLYNQMTTNKFIINDKYLPKLLELTKYERFGSLPENVKELISKEMSEIRDDFFNSFAIDGGSYGVDQNAASYEIRFNFKNREWVTEYENDIFSFLVNKKNMSNEYATAYLNVWKNDNFVGPYNYSLIEEFFYTVYKDDFEVAKIMSNNFSLTKNYLIDKLMSQGMNEYDAIKTLERIDSQGACSYATFANAIMMKFRNMPERFEEIFGYSMYKDINGKRYLNSSELLTDMYMYINSNQNGGKIFNFENGKYSINDLQAVQKYISTGFGFSDKDANAFIKSKKDNIYIDSETRKYYKNFDTLLNKEEMKNFILVNMQEDKEITLGIYRTENKKFSFYDYETRNLYIDTDTWSEGDGHAVFVSQVLEDGLVVSSWGEKLFINYNDFIENRFNINILDMEGI